MAIVRDGEDALALAIYGHQRSYFGRDFVEAMHCFDSAISACPSCDIAWTMKGATLGYMDDGANAIVCAENGVRLSPRGAHLFFAEHILAQAFYVASRFEEAIVWGRRSMSRNERLTSNLRTLAASFIATDQIEEAQAIARAHSTIAKQFSLAEWSAKTPFRGKILETFVARLLRAGM
jgi:tetratricopeptide (TPR) repeat protein